MKTIGTMTRFLVVGLAAVFGGLLGFFVAAACLMTLGVRLHGHEDYFSPFYHDAGTPASEFIGGAVFFGAGIFGFIVPLIVGSRRVKPPANT